jgi:hypothetical protein
LAVFLTLVIYPFCIKARRWGLDGLLLTVIGSPIILFLQSGFWFNSFYRRWIERLLGFLIKLQIQFLICLIV